MPPAELQLERRLEEVDAGVTASDSGEATFEGLVESASRRLATLMNFSDAAPARISVERADEFGKRVAEVAAVAQSARLVIRSRVVLCASADALGSTPLYIEARRTRPGPRLLVEAEDALKVVISQDTGSWKLNAGDEEFSRRLNLLLGRLASPPA